MSYFVSIGHILTHLVKFCLFQSYFAHIMSYIWSFFSWSISDQIDKVGQIVDAPPQPVTPRTIPALMLLTCYWAAAAVITNPRFKTLLSA